MTDYYRGAPQLRPAHPPHSSSTGPSYTTRPSARDVPSRQGSAPANYQVVPPPPTEPARGEGTSIKCSDCGGWVELMELGEHVCARSPVEVSLGDRKRRPDIRLDIGAAAPRLAAYGANLSARSPNIDPGFLGPASPSSRPNSPSYGLGESELSRSVSSQSSFSSTGSKPISLPFFDRYQKAFGGGTTGVVPSLTRSGAAQNLNALSSSNDEWRPPLTPSPMFAPFTTSRSPSPSPSPSLSNRQLANASPSFPPPRRPDSDSDLPYAASSADSRSSSSRRPGPQETPGSSIVSGSPPRSRKVSIPESGLSNPLAMRAVGGNGNASGNAPLPGSQSTPSKLNSFARPSGMTGTRKGRSKSEEERAGGVGLDACLEDLRLMTGDDEDEDGGAGELLRSFRQQSRRDLSPPRPFRPDYDDDLATTPRPAKRPTQIPFSRSTPSLAPLSSATSPTSPPGSFTKLSSSPSGSFAKLSSSPSEASLGAQRRTPTKASSCTTCAKAVRETDIQRAGDGQVFCRPCYADRFLPKCRKCKLPIEGGAVASSDGKVLGKYHPTCFNCYSCSSPFPNKEFYVFDYKPYCQLHYHELNGSLCTDQKCGLPIEGPCVSLVGEDNGGGGRYHPDCFKCSDRTCRLPLLDHHFVVKGLPVCERHAEARAPPPSSRPSAAAPNPSNSTSRARKRQTIITKR